MKIPLTLPYFDKEEEKSIIKVLHSGWVMQGPKVSEFEKKLSEFLGVKYVIAVNSGTAALHLSMLALDIKAGMEVIVPSFSFIASANCVLYTGAKPVFADIDEETYNIDPKEILKKITKKTKAVIAVHQIGLPAEMDEIRKICKNHKLFLIEDAACALGAEYKGKMVGGLSDLACFSFHPRKSITTGEGGLISTNNKELYEKLISLRSHGELKKDGREIYSSLGYNYRLTDLQAVLGLEQFKKLSWILNKRKELAQNYDRGFANNPKIIVPVVPLNTKHTYQSYMIRFKNTKLSALEISQQLTKKEIATRLGIMLIHKQPLYQKLFGKINLPVSEKVAKETLIIPLYPKMSNREQEFVIKSINNII